MPDTKGAIYVRVSRPSELDILANQKRAAIEHCETNRIDIGNRIYEEVVSGKDYGRAKWNEMMERARKHEFDIIVFTSLSRMTRGGIYAALNALNEFRRIGVGWHFVEQPTLNFDSTTPKLVSDIILAVLAAVDEDWRRSISVKTKAAYSRRKALAENRGEVVKWGRPKKDPVVQAETVVAVPKEPVKRLTKKEKSFIHIGAKCMPCTNGDHGNCRGTCACQHPKGYRLTLLSTASSEQLARLGKEPQIE